MLEKLCVVAIGNHLCQTLPYQAQKVSFYYPVWMTEISNSICTAVSVCELDPLLSGITHGTIMYKSGWLASINDLINQEILTEFQVVCFKSH